ncbi:MAG: hypothetical protein U0871_01195 [Gemmataceae bacterium]
MEKHTYPQQLYKKLRARWDGEPLGPGWPRVDLPQEAVLAEFLDVCYHASLMTDEGRQTVFRVALISGASAVAPPRQEPVELEPVVRYELGRPVPFNAAELRRLAPVADPRRVLIAVEHLGDAPHNRLQIYGLIDAGMALWEMARHERVMGTSSPQALVVASTRPGELIISRGDKPVLRLRSGEVISPTNRVLYHGPIARFFSDVTDELIREAVRRSETRRPDWDDGLEFAHLDFIESVLLHTADLRHGGALLFVPESTVDDDQRLHAGVSIKYQLPSTRPRDALLAAMASRLESNDARERLHSRRTIKRDDFDGLENLERHHRNLADSARDGALFIASLTAVDGAVVLTDKLRVIGFGGEVRASGLGTGVIHVAKNEEGDEYTEAPYTGYGTRHRSAFRFVDTIEPSVAFILSQDGGIKAAMKVGGRIVMWPYFEVGCTTALS